jgi:hypothetical protein
VPISAPTARHATPEHPAIEIAPCTLRGHPNGPCVRGEARLLEDVKDRYAPGIIEHKRPACQKVLIPLAHRLANHATTHYEATQTDDAPV